MAPQREISSILPKRYQWEMTGDNQVSTALVINNVFKFFFKIISSGDFTICIGRPRFCVGMIPPLSVYSNEVNFRC